MRILYRNQASWSFSELSVITDQTFNINNKTSVKVCIV